MTALREASLNRRPHRSEDARTVGERNAAARLLIDARKAFGRIIAGPSLRREELERTNERECRTCVDRQRRANTRGEHHLGTLTPLTSQRFSRVYFGESSSFVKSISPLFHCGVDCGTALVLFQNFTGMLILFCLVLSCFVLSFPFLFLFFFLYFSYIFFKFKVQGSRFKVER